MISEVFMTVAAKVALDKKNHPDKFCPKCLWKTGGGFCPRHAPANLQVKSGYVPKAGECRDARHVDMERVNTKLLKALKAINSHWESGNFSRLPELWDPMREAIAEAEGDI